MQIVITGTPGTGKTSVAAEMSDEDLDTVSLTEFIEENDLGENSEGSEIEVDVDLLVEALDENFGDVEDLVIEGHLSHYFPADYCVVLRCRPDILENRLEEREYSKEKIIENVQAEALDIVLQEAVNEQDNVIEIDTTEKDVEDTVSLMMEKIRNERTGYGEIDWSEFL